MTKTHRMPYLGALTLPGAIRVGPIEGGKKLGGFYPGVHLYYIILGVLVPRLDLP